MPRPRRALPSTATLLLLVACQGHGPPPSAGPEGPPDARRLDPFDPAGVGPGAPPTPGPARPLDAIDYGPIGRTEGAGQIHVRFNQPVVALGLPDDTDYTKLFTFDPPLPGRAYFKTPDLLVFDPDGPLADCQEYTARFTGGLAALAGQRFDRPLTWTFETVRPTVVGADPGAGAEDLRRDSVILFQLDRPAALAEVRAHVAATARPLNTEGPPVPVAVTVREATAREMRDAFYIAEDQTKRNRRQIYAVKARTLWPAGSEVEVSVTPGLVSEAGPLPLDTPWSMNFKTYRAQGIASLSCAPDEPCGLEPIRLTLRNPVTDREARKITVTPKPQGFVVNLWDTWEDHGREISLEGMYIPGTTYTVHIPAGMRDIFGQSLPATKRAALIAPKATLALSDAGGILVAGRAEQPTTIGVETRHVARLRVRLGVFDDRELRALSLDAEDVAKMPFPARTLVHTIPLSPTGKGDWSSVALDLAALTENARRPILVEVAADELVAHATPYGKPPTLRGLYRVTDLGPVAVTSLPASGVQVFKLSNSAPVAGATVSRHDASGGLTVLGTTDQGGHLALPADVVAPQGSHEDAKQRPVRLVVADPATDDRTFLDVDGPNTGNRWRSKADIEAEAKKNAGLRPGERLIARVVSERGVYRPGEVVRVVGWSALDTPFARSNLGRLAPGTPVTFELVDPYDQVVAVHPTKTTDEGKYWAELAIPGEARLGRYDVRATIGGTTVETTVKVEDYRVPEFSVDATTRRPDIFVGESTELDVRASYYFGGPVPIRRLTTATTCRLQRYRPPNLDLQWSVGESPVVDREHLPLDTGRVVQPTIEPDPSPGRRLHTSTPDLGGPRYPGRCTVAFEVQDASLQGIGAEAGYNVHPAAFYLAVAPPRQHLRAGDRGVALPVRAVDLHGERVAASAVEVAVTRHWRADKYRSEGGRQVYDGTEEKEEQIKTCRLDVPATGDDPTCALPPVEEGRYALALVARDAAGREAHTAAGFHVWRKIKGFDWRTLPPPARLEVALSSASASPGDTLEAVVRAPDAWNGAAGTLVLARGGIREQRPFVIAENAARFSFPVDDSWAPKVAFQAFVVTPKTQGTARPRVEEAAAFVEVPVAHRYLRVQVDAPAKVGPGDAVDLAVHVRDTDDKPVAARVALWAVDEAVLDLTNYEVPDLLPHFVPRRDAELADFNDLSTILYPFHANPTDPWFDPLAYGLRGIGAGGGGSGFGRGGGAGFGGRGARAANPPARSRFETTPVFLADLAVDATGDARVQATMPENLTTFRITAVASARLVDGESPGRFGKNDARTMVTAPLVVRSVLPRALRPGDVAEAAAIVQNNTGAAGKVTVTATLIETPGSQGQVLKLMSPGTATADVPEGGQVRLPFEVAAQLPGAPEFELQAVFTPTGGGPQIHDGVRVPLPVAAERTLTERVAAYGTVTDDEPVAIPIQIPRDVLPGHGGVTVAATSSLLGGLEDAVDALVDYPYGCVEQTSSKLLPLIALHDLRQSYPLGIADPQLFMKSGVDRLLTMQTKDGGFGYWPGATDVHPYASAYATWVLHLAHKAGYPVPADALKKALDDLERRVGGITMASVAVDWGAFDGSRLAIALHVLAEAGRDVHARAGELYTRRQSLPLYARAFLLLALHRMSPQSPEVHALAAELRGNLQETPATAHTAEATTYALDEFFHSDGRSDAILLIALLRVEPDHPVVIKLARGLLERRIGGKWRNTQENAYALVALTDYARVYEADVPDFTARAWVGQQNVLDAKFTGREFTTRSTTTEMTKILGLAPEGDDPLGVVLQRQGAGRLYYRLGAEWAPRDQAGLPARAQGLTVTRALRVKEGAVAGSVTAGEPVAMDITVATDVRVRYVAIDVPLPAGLEGVSRTLGQGRGAATLGGHRGWWTTHEEQRADRVVVFADDLPPGTHHHTIDLRATSRGKFSFPPVHAEAMYMPEVYGRTAGANLEVR